MNVYIDEQSCARVRAIARMDIVKFNRARQKERIARGGKK
jgi:hypothetical protein